MMRIMRTTISLDDQLSARVRREAHERQMSVSAFIAATLSDALLKPEPPPRPPFRLVTAPGARPRPTVDLNRPRAIDIEHDEMHHAPSRR
ncbi:MAG: ribbon-helix-helix protein, CopG family [Acidimicrobiales bacterium]|nr:ribbon-helix-helix protein, CopG family [Acidimicrobiales bacterium]MXX44387.1 ribbon-helix-helix protein, CopG family [Acidimicrobiales bacterium]MXZ16228.1 ribbon-helix-helix protein, CopG family [Acidimicrobiales bacterium]MYA27711.1 ribbon-helix-helix protein, CopG family [Acidimicrobiales bacterium]MYA82266.1 ribbon-helix-helix protein, CopG family [Acidimicrobiales bacterium]